MLVSREGLRILPLVLGVPDLDKQVRRACHCKYSHQQRAKFSSVPVHHESEPSGLVRKANKN